MVETPNVGISLRIITGQPAALKGVGEGKKFQKRSVARGNQTVPQGREKSVSDLERETGVAKFILVEGCPWVSSAPSSSIPPWKRANHVQQGQNKGQHPQFLRHVKAESFGA